MQNLFRKAKLFFLSKETESGWIQRFPDIALIYLLFSLSYFLWYLTEPAIPANDVSKYMGWWGWWDQGQYWKTAGELASAHLGQAQYWWGYPLIGALFYKLVPAHPFFFPNYVLGYIVVLFFYLMAVRFVTRIEAYALVIVLILGSKTMMFESLIIPWNTIVTYASIFSISYLLVFSRPSRLAIYFCITLVALVTLVRPSDTPFLLAYLILVLFLQNDRKAFVKFSGLAVLSTLIAAAILALLNILAYKNIIPPYVAKQEEVGMSLSGIWFRLYQLYIDGILIHGNSTLPPGSITPVILTQLPLMVFAPAGAWLLWRRVGPNILALVGVCIGAIIYFVAFNAAGNPPHFWSYLLFHYFWWTGVILSLLGYIFLREWGLHHEVPRIAKHIAMGTVLALIVIGFGEMEVNSVKPEVRQVGEMAQFTFKFDSEIEDGLRLDFQNPLPFHLTVAGKYQIVSVEINGEKWSYWKDFMISQEANTVNFRFYRSLPRGKVTAIITFDGLANADLVSARWIRIKFQPFAMIYRLTNWLLGPEAAIGTSPYLPSFLRFESKDGSLAYLQSGWSTPEGEYVWSIQRNAQLRLNVDSKQFDNKNCSIDIDFATFGSNTLALTMNGTPLGAPIYTSGMRQSARFSPCPEVKSSEITLSVNVGQLKSPADNGMSNDHRKLGVALYGVKIVNKKNDLGIEKKEEL